MIFKADAAIRHLLPCAKLPKLASMNNADAQNAQVIDERLGRPLILVGMMGAGKSRIGRVLAASLGWPFRDADDEIEADCGMTINAIFAQSGEAFFRAREQAVVSRLLDEGRSVIAAGGGALTSPETAMAVKTKAVSVWVRAELAVLTARAAKSDDRPLLRNGDAARILGELIDRRQPLYARSDLVIDNGDLPVSTVVSRLLGLIADYAKASPA